MKKLIFAMVVLCGQSVFANTAIVPSQFLAEPTATQKSNNALQSVQFADDVDHMMSVQQDSLEKMEDNSKHTKIKFTQMLTSFGVTRSGLFGLSALGVQSATTLWWTKKKVPLVNEEPNKFAITDNDDELSLQMKIDDITSYLVSEKKVSDPSALRDNLDKVLRKGHELFMDMDNLESQSWRVGGYRLDLSISASGVVAPFTKVGENVRLWLEWAKAPKANKEASTPNTKAAKFVSNVLMDIEAATAKVQMSHFALTQLYVGLGEDFKTSALGFATAQVGFVGYVKFVPKPKSAATITVLAFDSEEADYPVIQEESAEKTNKLVTISRNKIRKGIENSLKFAQFFDQKSDRLETTHWEVTQIREIATISKTGLFGLSSLTTKGSFTFMFNKVKPQAAEKSMSFNNPLGTLSLIRLSFVTVLGYNIPEIANFEVRPNVELFWK